MAAVEAEPIDSDSDMDENHYSPAPPEPDNNSMDASESAQWTQVQVPDEDSRHSFISNHDEHAIIGTGMKITLAKPITLQGSPTRDQKRRKSDLREVFNPDEDDSNIQVKKRKLVPLGNVNFLCIQRDSREKSYYQNLFDCLFLCVLFLAVDIELYLSELIFRISYYLFHTSSTITSLTVKRLDAS